MIVNIIRQAIERLEEADRRLAAGSRPAEAQLEILAARNMLRKLLTLEEEYRG